MDKKEHLFTMIVCFLIVIPLRGKIFKTPDILVDNVIFWKKIYAEVSLDEGLIHDRDYPLVIFKKISVKTNSSRQKSLIIKSAKNKIKNLLYTVNTEPRSSWPSEAKKIIKLYKRHASLNAMKTAGSRIRFQSGQKERFRQGLYRSGAYLDTIKAIFKHFNIPKRLIYLPHVESSFNPYACSKAGAAGLWQFMRSTGRLYLKINYLVDERRDPLLSTYAAAKHLTRNYKHLKSWPLAITAYNHGLYGMKRAVRQTGSKNISTIIKKHSSGSFRFASKNFYSCFLAASEIAKNPKKYFPGITFAPPLKYRSININYYLRPDHLAHYIGISKKKLKYLNPAIRSIVFSENKLIPKGTTLNIPYSLSPTTAVAALSGIPDSLKISTPPKPKYYRVGRGDNLFAIARKFNTSARKLALENNIHRMNRIYIGQILQIPRKNQKRATLKPVQVAATTIKSTSKKVKPKNKKTAKMVTSASHIIADIVTKSHDSIITKYSDKFDADVYNLDIVVRPGENLATIWISVNETLSHYAKWLNIRTQQLRRVNRMGRRSRILVNQKLTIPVSKEKIDHFTSKRLEYHMALEEDFYNQYRVTDIKKEIIRSGGTLWDIWNNDEIIPLWLLRKFNRYIDFNRLVPKMTVWIPVIEEILQSEDVLNVSIQKE
ncbi:MAG: transglycosylase SLT domain-containing protein [Chitinispirillia bacterium]|jgi:membrane-bound lytic murein transglycosylase D